MADLNFCGMCLELRHIDGLCRRSKVLGGQVFSPFPFYLAQQVQAELGGETGRKQTWTQAAKTICNTKHMQTGNVPFLTAHASGFLSSRSC